VSERPRGRGVGVPVLGWWHMRNLAGVGRLRRWRGTGLGTQGRRGIGGGRFSWMGKLRIGELLAYVGMYSYSIYLWHVMISLHSHWPLRLVWPKIGETGFFWAYVVASLGGGIVLSRPIEHPALHVRDRLSPSRGGQGVGSGDRVAQTPASAAVACAAEARDVQIK